MTIHLVQFFAPFRGCIWVEVRSEPGETADMIARRVIVKALDLFNRKWPGCLREELTACGISDGVRALNRKGEEAPPVDIHDGRRGAEARGIRGVA